LRRAVACAHVAFVVATAGAARAAPAKVALVREPSSSAVEQKALTRLRAELIAAGFEVTEVERHSDDAREAAEADPGAEGVFATVAIVPRAGSADIWVADRVTGKTVVRRIEARSSAGHDVASILAVRAVELLQASLLEAIERPAREEPTQAAGPPSSPAAPLPADVSTWMQARRAPPETRYGLQAGLGVIHSFDGIGPAFMPVLGLSYRMAPAFVAAVRAGGPAFAADLQVEGGTIAVRQWLAMLELTYELPWSTSAVRPFVVGAAGVYHLDVAGAATPPYYGQSTATFAALFTAGAGAKLRLGDRVALLADLRLLIVAPQPVVRAAEQPVASMSRPSLFGQLALDVAF
jgi:hypothetical protein